MSTKPRLIDSYDGAMRTKPMRVLALGMGRTATKSLANALNSLGLNCYHNSTAALQHPHHYRYWIEAMEIKHSGEGKPYGREEFDKLIGDYDAISDVPGCMFVDELVAAYPEAKVISNYRNVDSWLESMHSTVFALLPWKSYQVLQNYDDTISLFYNSIKWELKLFCDNDYSDERVTQAFHSHYKHIADVCDREKNGEVLHWSPPFSWDPLCGFIGEPVPDLPFPHSNDSSTFLEAMTGLRNAAIIRIAKKGALALTPVAAALGGAWYYQRRFRR